MSNLKNGARYLVSFFRCTVVSHIGLLKYKYRNLQSSVKKRVFGLHSQAFLAFFMPLLSGNCVLYLRAMSSFSYRFRHPSLQTLVGLQPRFGDKLLEKSFGMSPKLVCPKNGAAPPKGSIDDSIRAPTAVRLRIRHRLIWLRLSQQNAMKIVHNIVLSTT